MAIKMKYIFLNLAYDITKSFSSDTDQYAKDII